MLVKEGDSVILKSNDGSSYFGEASSGGTCRIRELSFPSGALIGVEYGSVWEITSHGRSNGIKKAEDGELVPVGAFSDAIRGGLSGVGGGGTGDAIDGQLGGDEEVEVFDNRFLVDSNKSQSVSTAEIASMKAKGKSGEDIVRALVENSTTFSSKTAFSQQKYITKKTNKYIRRFRVMTSTAVSICELAHELYPDKVLGLRADSLGAILNAANVEPGKRVMVFDGTTGLLTGAVMERMIDFRALSDDVEQSASATESATSSSSSSSSSASPSSTHQTSSNRGTIFLPFEDKRSIPNLSMGSKFNLPPGQKTQQMLVGLQYKELVEWVDPIAQMTFSRYSSGGDSGMTALPLQTTQPSPQATRITGQKRGRDEIKDDSINEKREPPAHQKQPIVVSNPPPPVSVQAAVPGAIQFFRAPVKSKKEINNKQAKNSSSAPVTKLTKANRQLKLWPYATDDRKNLLSDGVDSVIVAVQYDPMELVLSAIRYCRPSCSLVVFSRDVFALGRVFSVLRKADCAVNILLEEKFTRELQVLAGRTHPHMMMHAASSFMLSGTIIPSRFSALYFPKRALKPAPILSSQLPSTSALSSSSAAASSAEVSTDVSRMKEALVLASSCVRVETAYNVGALLVGSSGEVLATGFSREIEGNTHAEEVCLMKMMKKGEEGSDVDGSSFLTRRSDLLRGATLYSTMEPCSKRLSGKKPCCELLAESGIARVVIAVREPSTFVQKCEGADRLEFAGIKVDFLDDRECQSQALAANDHLKL